LTPAAGFCSAGASVFAVVCELPFWAATSTVASLGSSQLWKSALKRIGSLPKKETKI
jgi:hypothetical protein